MTNTNNRKYTTLVWDWNGTLLNDVDASILTINKLLEKRQFRTLTKEHYLEIFRFPVIEYYHELGFDFTKERWEDVALEYMNIYHAQENSFTLFPEVKNILSHFKNRGYKQYILSAMKTESIETMLKNFNIKNFFDGVYGLDNQYANGKISLGHEFIKQENINTAECAMIGDTSHDAEVATALDIDCCLISNGHQSDSRLKDTEITVLNDITALVNKF